MSVDLIGDIWGSAPCVRCGKTVQHRYERKCRECYLGLIDSRDRDALRLACADREFEFHRECQRSAHLETAAADR